MTSFRFCHQTARGFLRKSSASLPVSLFQVHRTSLDVNGFPSCHLTPCRSLKVSLVLLASQLQLSARSGTIDSGVSSGALWSKTTRLLKTAMNGATVEMVASS